MTTLLGHLLFSEAKSPCVAEGSQDIFYMALASLEPSGSRLMVLQT